MWPRGPREQPGERKAGRVCCDDANGNSRCTPGRLLRRGKPRRDWLLAAVLLAACAGIAVAVAMADEPVAVRLSASAAPTAKQTAVRQAISAPHSLQYLAAGVGRGEGTD